jgi:hypothetical protein
VKEGRAKSLDDAVSGHWISVERMHGTLAIRGSEWKYELACEHENVVRPNQGADMKPIVPNGEDPEKTRATRINCASIREVIDQDSLMRLGFSSILHAANLTKGNPPLNVKTPLSMGVIGPNEAFSFDKEVFRCRRANIIPTDDGMQILDGREVIVITTPWQPGSDTGYGRKWYLDPLRGYVPVRVEILSGDAVCWANATAIDQSPGGGFYSSSSIMSCKNDGYDQVTIIGDTKAAWRPPTDSEISLVLPAGCVVAYPPDMRASFRLDKQEVVSARELPRYFERCQESLPRPIQNPRTWSSWVWIIALVVSPFVISYLILSKRKR